MSEQLVFLNGKLVSDSSATVSIHDAGFTLGDAVYEATRTFNGVPFKLDEHVSRLFLSLRYAAIDPGMTPHEMEHAILDTLEANRTLLKEDVFIYIYITRGHYLDNIRHYLPASAGERKPTIVISVAPLVFSHYARGYKSGVPAVIVSRRHISHQSLDPKLKTTSRMHLVLAEMEARRIDPQAWSIILDPNGNLAENKSSNLFLVLDGSLHTPRTDHILPGITRATIIELARRLGIPVIETDLQPYHTLTAEEAFFTATGFCIMPVTRINSVILGEGLPGPITRRLFRAWSEMVGVDIEAQAYGAAASAQGILSQDA